MTELDRGSFGSKIGLILATIGRELLEVLCHKSWVAMQFAHDAGIHILQAPARNHRIVTGNQEAREHLQVAYPLPSRSIGGGVIPCLRNIDRKSE